MCDVRIDARLVGHCQSIIESIRDRGLDGFLFVEWVGDLVNDPLNNPALRSVEDPTETWTVLQDERTHRTHNRGHGCQDEATVDVRRDRGHNDSPRWRDTRKGFTARSSASASAD
jgi:hypothetical protein